MKTTRKWNMGFGKNLFLMGIPALLCALGLMIAGCDDGNSGGGGGDTTAPTLSLGSVTALSSVAGTTATLKFTSNEAGTYYYVVLPATTAAPTGAAVKAATSGIKGTAAATASENTISVTGLTAGTAYKAYIVVQDASGNLSPVLMIDGVNPVAQGPSLVPETTPSATIDYADETLTGLTSNAIYIVNTSAKPAGASGTIPIESGWFGTTLSIKKTGNGATTSDSAAQSLPIPERPPISVVAIQPTSINGTGGINGTNSGMEYKLAAVSTWTAITGSSVTGLAAGSYVVRVKATSSAFKSVEFSVTISPFGAGQEAIPNATIDYVNEKLTGLTASANYTVNGGTKTADASGTIAIENGWFGTMVSIKKTGNGTTTIDSLAQSLPIPARPAVPTGVAGGTAKIIGTTVLMEYKTASGGSWTDCSATETTVAEGSYVVRFKATGSAFAGEETGTLTVAEPVLEATPNASIDYVNEELTGLVNGIYTITGFGTIVISDNTCWLGSYISASVNVPLSIVKKGDGTTTTDSAAQTLTLPKRPAAPSVSGNVGKITNTTTSMEYKLTSGYSWADCSATETAVAAGSYVVRLKATGSAFAGVERTLAVSTVTTSGNIITASSSATAEDVKAALTAYLSSASGGDWDYMGDHPDPIAVKINVSTLAQLTDSDDAIGILFSANPAGKWVSYDLSDSALTTISGSSTYRESFYANRLVSVTLPNSLTSIGNSAFAGCNMLTSVTIPNSVTSIGYRAFSNCYYGLTSITIPDSVTSIDREAFYYCYSLTSVTISNGVTSISDGTFRNCTSLTSVTIPNGVTSIGYEAFYGCSGLTSVTIPNSVTSIRDSAFSGCSGLTSVTIPNSVTSIRDSAFSGCSALTSITVDSGNTNYKSIDGILCNNAGTNLILCPEGKTGTYTIPNGVTSIGDSAFRDCTDLTSVTIPNSVTSIGDYAFLECSGLTSVTIGNGVTSIGMGAFEYCTGLTSVTIPNSITSIGRYAFEYCTGLTSVIMRPSTPPILGSYVFSYTHASFKIKVGIGLVTTYRITSVSGWTAAYKALVEAE